ncbi:MAG: helix-turn-helix transcriptional regulator [Planctomycetota bacterium]|nr:helix-turn-helix transcriptional regulator [Planctomycetota bacterium]
MSRFAAALQQEIRRLARKEVRALTSVTRRAAAQHRRDIASLKRQVRVLTRQVAVLETLERKQAAIAPAPQPAAEKARFSPGWVRTRRARLGLSAEAYGKLIGVSPLTIYQWEHGKSRPRRNALARLVAVKDIGRREALQRLEMLAGNKKRQPAKRARKRAVRRPRKARR